MKPQHTILLDQAIPDQNQTAADSTDVASKDVWGFEDTEFQFNSSGQVLLAGDRYEGLSGHVLPNLRSWFEQKTGMSLDPEDYNHSHYASVECSAPDVSLQAQGKLDKIFSADQQSIEPLIRIRHGHGHTQEDMYQLKHGKVSFIPDMVVFPESDEQIERLVKIAIEEKLVIIPYGGGTNVTGALSCPPSEKRTCIVVSMCRMNKILWLDEANGMAKIQSGIVGAELQQQLAAQGYTMGHEPDSIEFSTLGGWIATNASGMKKNRYGNIEDIVLDITAITASGRLERRHAHARESTGIDPRTLFFGSEGSLGIITNAVIRITPLPEVQSYGSVVFPSFEDGVAFMRALAKTGDWPASARLVDNTQFQLGMVLKPESRGLAALKSKIEKWLMTSIAGFDQDEMVVCTLVYEGQSDAVALQRKSIKTLSRKFGGIPAGAGNGERGYKVTFSIGYVRDFCMRYWFLGESFETTVPWDRTLEVCQRVKARLHKECQVRGLPGTPFISCRVTQLYATSCCVYFYFAYHYKGVANPTALFHELETCARLEILDCGGSLSHHHGIGKLRQSMLKDVMSDDSLRMIEQTKDALDPDNIFGAGNIAIAATTV